MAGGCTQAFPVWDQFLDEEETAKHKLSVLAMPGTPVPGRLTQEDDLSLVVRGQPGQWRDQVQNAGSDQPQGLQDFG